VRTVAGEGEFFRSGGARLGFQKGNLRALAHGVMFAFKVAGSRTSTIGDANMDPKERLIVRLIEFRRCMMKLSYLDTLIDESGHSDDTRKYMDAAEDALTMAQRRVIEQLLEQIEPSLADGE
jgi:hypothetical protein